MAIGIENIALSLVGQRDIAMAITGSDTRMLIGVGGNSAVFEYAVSDFSFSPRSLFAASEPGVWLDPSDLSTLFQDNAGTTPVTAAGQSVGRILDKSGRGNHATQSTAASRPIYGVEPSTGRRNLLTYTEQFDNAAWGKIQVSVSPDSAIAPDGTLTADKLIQTAISSAHAVTQTIGAAAGSTRTVYAKAAGYNFLAMTYNNSAANSATYNLTTGAITNIGANVTSTSATSVGNGWWRVSMTVNATATFVQDYVLQGPGFLAETGDGTSGIFLWGAQLEPGSTATAYQRVVSQYDVSEAGLPSVAYLFDDLIDDSLNWTAPAGSYTVAWCDTAGNVTIQTAQALSGATDALRTQRMVGYLAINRALTAAETANLTAWLQRKAGG